MEQSLDERIEELAGRITDLYDKIVQIPVIEGGIDEEIEKRLVQTSKSTRGDYISISNREVNSVLGEAYFVNFANGILNIHEILKGLETDYDVIKEVNAEAKLGVLERLYSILEGDVRTERVLKRNMQKENPIIYFLGFNGDGELLLSELPKVAVPIIHTSGAVVTYEHREVGYRY